VGEVVGFAAFTIGARDSVAVASVLASQFAALGAIGAYLLFKERLGRLQVIGVVVLVLGVTTLTLLRST
jgi:drug/metabolite transporter (DMT)-like permease